MTVLFADVADYTRLSEKLDPEEVHEIMDGCFRILMDEIHQCEGTVNQFTGDGVMALFGAPVAHEDHARRACHAALGIQVAVKEYGRTVEKEHGVAFMMRIGLNSGPVVVGSIGDDLRMDYTALGDTTNLASRMEGIAEPGIILVTGSTHRLSRDFFHFRSLGRVKLKGKDEPQEAYELLTAGDVATRIEAAAARGLTRFVGRTKEMEALKGACDKARSGAGRVVGIVGEAGVGKSRLLVELKSMITGEAKPPGGRQVAGEKEGFASKPSIEIGMRYLEGRCLHYGGSMAYLPVLDILKGFLGIKEEDREQDIKKKLRDGLQAQGEKHLPSLHELLSLVVEDEKYMQLGPQQRREQTFEAVRDILVHAARERSLIIAVEDLHWIDRTSEAFLDYLIGGLEDVPILLIILYRPEYTHTWGNRPCYTQVRLGPLSVQTSAELVQAILEGAEVVPELRELILGRTGGNPLFVEELTHSLLENGSIQQEDHRFVLARKASDMEVPETIQGIISARMDRVEENLKRIMQVASVIGREFAFRILQTITEMKEDLKASLLNLEGLEFIYEKQLFPELEYIFKHALTQEVAYGSLLVKRRKEIHERIGQAMEQLYAERLEEYYELLAYHYVRSDNTVKAVEYLALANRKAEKANAMEQAKAYFDKAMELLDTLPDTEENRERRISLLGTQSLMFHLLMKIQEYHGLLTRYEPVADGLEDPGLKGTFYASLGVCETVLGSFDQAIRSATRAAELCETAGNSVEAGRAYWVLVWSYTIKGDFEEALANKEKVLRKMEEKFNLPTYARSLGMASICNAFLGRWDEAEELGKKGLSAAREYDDNSQISFTAFFLSGGYTMKEDMARAIEYGEIALENARTPMNQVFSKGGLAYARCKAGDPEKGLRDLEGIVQALRTARFVPATLMQGVCLVEGYFLTGEVEKARHTAEELLELSDRCGARFFLGVAHYYLGMIALETDPVRAAPHFEKAIDILRELKAENYLALAYAGYGRFHKQQGRIKEAREYMTRALGIFERLGTLIEPEKVRQELAGLPQES